MIGGNVVQLLPKYASESAAFGEDVVESGSRFRVFSGGMVALGFITTASSNRSSTASIASTTRRARMHIEDRSNTFVGRSLN